MRSAFAPQTSCAKRSQITLLAPKAHECGAFDHLLMEYGLEAARSVFQSSRPLHPRQKEETQCPFAPHRFFEDAQWLFHLRLERQARAAFLALLEDESWLLCSQTCERQARPTLS